MIENWTADNGQQYLQQAGHQYMDDMLAAYTAGHLDAGLGKAILNQLQVKIVPLLKQMDADFRSEQQIIQEGFNK